MIRRRLKTYTRLSAYWLAFVLLFTSSWLGRKFGHPNFEQVLYHLQFGSTGLIDVDQGLIWSFIRQCLLAPLIPTLFLYNLEKAVIQIREAGFNAYRAQLLATLKTGITRVGKLSERLCFYLFRRRLPFALIIIAAVILLSQLSFWSYIQSLQYSSFFEENYAPPTDIQAPAHKRNLVLIYVESMEQSFAERNLFGSNLIEGFNAAYPFSQSIEQYLQTPGTGWTVAGIVSSQCGVPLRPVTMAERNASNELVKEFMANATCLGDILEQNGYTNIFMGGAGLDFSGKGKFLINHGYQQVLGKTDWREQGETKFNDWGLFDDRLLAHAELEIDRLERQGKPYNLTLLTVDTHFPEGHLSDTCKKRGATDYQGIVICTADLVGNLVSYIHQRGYSKNTDVVVIGDHLAMAIPLEDKLNQVKQRSIFNRFYTDRPLQKNRSVMYHYDLLPTILYVLGFHFPENRLALGASAFGPLSSTYDLHKEEDLETKLKAPSSTYQALWQSTPDGP